MEKIRKFNVTVIRRSCITGKIIWVYRGMSKNAANVAYHRAWKHELERIKHWPEYVAERKANILKLLNDCLANLPITAELTPKQKAAARRLRKMAETEPECDLDFYNHIIEEQRRRAEDQRIRQQMRQRAVLERAAANSHESRL